METETVFRIILPMLIITFVIHRGYYVQKHGEARNTLKKREVGLGLVSKLAGILGLIGFAWLGMTILEVASRISFEENLLLEYFGEQYREYMKRTGRLLPKLIQ